MQEAPQAAFVSLQPSETNSIEVASYGAGVIEQVLQLGSLATTLFNDTKQYASLTRTESCTNGGLVEFEFIDVDQSETPTSGDSIRATYRDCFLAQLNKTVAGDFNISIDEISDTEAASIVTMQIDAADMEIADNQGTVLSLQNAFDVRYEERELNNALSVSGRALFLYDDGSDVLEDLIDNFEFTRVVSKQSARYTVTASGQVSSEVLQGQFDIVAGEGLSGFLGTYPEQGG
ncbi:MAG: hypothetical protein AB8B86_09410, partial [Pseudomonadales bacterium]